jgi:hypothetical protein
MVDDATAAYIVENQKCFEDLKQVAAQLAGMLVLAAAGSKEAAPDHPALRSAHAIFREANDLVLRARPTERANLHHTHLTRAAVAIGMALSHASDVLNVDPILIPLRAGYAELERAADSLPGFEKISYRGACCHRGPIA